MKQLENFEVIELTKSKGQSVLTVSSSRLRFNKMTAKMLHFTPYIHVFLNKKERKVAIQVCAQKDANAISFSEPEGQQSYSIILKDPVLVAEFQKLLEPKQEGKTLTYTIPGTLYPEEEAIIYDIADAKCAVVRGGRKKKERL